MKKKLGFTDAIREWQKSNCRIRPEGFGGWFYFIVHHHVSINGLITIMPDPDNEHYKISDIPTVGFTVGLKSILGNWEIQEQG